MKRMRLISISFLIIAIISFNSSASHIDSAAHPLGEYDFWLGPLSSKVYSFYCESNDTLAGEFVVTIDGDFFEGDQKKYDLWVGWGDGIDIYIFDDDNYESWIEGESRSSLYSEIDVTTLSWIVTIPSSGNWYVIIDNDSSVYGKRVEGSIIHQNQYSGITQVLVLTLSVILITILALAASKHLKKKE